VELPFHLLSANQCTSGTSLIIIIVGQYFNGYNFAKFFNMLFELSFAKLESLTVAWAPLKHAMIRF